MKNSNAIAWTLQEIQGLSPRIVQHRIALEENAKPVRQAQRRLNPMMQEVVKKEIDKLLTAGHIFSIADSKWVSPVHVVPKKGGITVIKNDQNDLIPTKTVTGWRM